MKQNLLIAVLLLTVVFHAQSNTGIGIDKFDEPRKKIRLRNVVRIYPNPSYNGTVSVSSNINDKIHFYIFDLEGTLIHQAVLKNKERQTIQNLTRGMYMYDVFKDDMSVDHGKLEVR
jgi:hypothetical protein